MPVPSLPSAHRERLVRVLGMLGSDHDGERASASQPMFSFTLDRNASTLSPHLTPRLKTTTTRCMTKRPCETLTSATIAQDG